MTTQVASITNLFVRSKVKMRSRGYVFTLNNYTEEEVEALRQCGSKYLIFGKEVGESGTPHLQGYVWFTNKKSLKQMKKLSPRAHWEAQRGSTEQAAEYCKKDGNFEELGICPIKKRLDAQTRIKRLREAPLSELVDSGELSMFSVSSIKKARIILAQENSEYTHDDVRGEWYWGPPGTGKSRKAREDNPGCFIKPQSKWWDGYSGQDAVLLDDLDTNVLGHYLKIWADRYSCSGEIKGGTVNLCHKKIIITSNYHPDSLWTEDNEMLEAIKRRFKITHFTNLQ